jgi:hypothetical protein
MKNFDYWENYSIPIRGFDEGEFNEFSRWESFSLPPLIFGLEDVPTTRRRSAFFQFF